MAALPQIQANSVILFGNQNLPFNPLEPLTCRDIQISKLIGERLPQRVDPEIVFEVLNKKKVEAFLANDRLQKFLTDPHHSDNSGGCGFTITYVAEKNLLSIKNALKNTSDHAAPQDLVCYIKMFIYAPTNLAERDYKNMAKFALLNDDNQIDTKEYIEDFVSFPTPIDSNWKRAHEFYINQRGEQAKEDALKKPFVESKVDFENSTLK